MISIERRMTHHFQQGKYKRLFTFHNIGWQDIEVWQQLKDLFLCPKVHFINMWMDISGENLCYNPLEEISKMLHIEDRASSWVVMARARNTGEGCLALCWWTTISKRGGIFHTLPFHNTQCHATSIIPNNTTENRKGYFPQSGASI